MAYEALYRRYRPSRFEDAFFGQDHIKAALTNAIEGDRVGHAYLFSGPRGTGKTTSARILAKALNCTNLQGGEPCNECDSCEAFSTGSSYDLHELDAASNNGVDAMRDLIGKVALGSPGRTKVYILDEVHMLSSGAENALLKTLEEPPPHVVFVLCTTEPNKVVPTIRSRTQHLEFSLLNQAEVGSLVDHVTGDAGLEITAEDRAYVIRAGGGSARDTLSALDQVIAAGGAPRGGEHLDNLFHALTSRDSSAALTAIDGAMQAGRDPAGIATALLAELRSVFLVAMRADLSHLPDAERERAQAFASAMPPARVTRAIEVLGTSTIEMRQAPDPRVDLEVAIMRLTRADLDVSPAALLERIEALEAGAPRGAAPVAPAAPVAQAAPVEQAPAPAPAAAPVQAAAPVEAPPQSAPPAQAPAAEPQTYQEPQNYQEPPSYQEPQGYDDGPPPYGEPAPAPAPQVAPAAAPAMTDGRRGADMVRKALAKQSGNSGDPMADSPNVAPAPAAAQPAAAPAPASDAPPQTLADRRRQRQAAVASEPGAADAPPAQQAPPADQPMGQQAPPPQQAPPQEQAPQQAPAQQQPAPQEQVPQQQAPPQQAPPQQPPVAEQQPTAQPAPEQPTAPPVQQPPMHEAPPEAPAAQPAPTAAPPAAGGTVPTLPQLEAAWGEGMMDTMSGRVRSRFSAGRWMDSEPDSAIFGLPNPVHRDRCEEVRAEVDTALAARFGGPVPLRLVVDTAEVEPDIFQTAAADSRVQSDEPGSYEEEEAVDMDALVDAGKETSASGVDLVLETFEGSVVLDDPSPDGQNER